MIIEGYKDENSYKQPFIQIYNDDCVNGLKKINDNSVDCVLTDPPYLYLKGQKLERVFNEKLFFSECWRILKPGGFIVLFGRGTSFYRWNTLLDDLGFSFKEEIIWNKSHGSSPLMAITRVHETISIHSKGKSSINKVKIPYLEMKSNNIESIISDVKRMKSILKNTESLNAVLAFLENNEFNFSDRYNIVNGNETTTKGKAHLDKPDRAVSVINSFKNGMNEKTIIRTDRTYNEKFTKHNVTSDNRQTGDRAANVMQSISAGMNEKSIIQEVREHYTSIHPTQKPVSLIKRLLALTAKKGDTIVDGFAGSCSTGIACANMEMNFIGFEIDKEYFDLSIKRLMSNSVQLDIF